MNKFEKVSSDDYQMLLAGGGYVQGRDGYVQRGCPDGGGYVQMGVDMSGGMSRGTYHVTYPMMHVMLSTPYS